MHKLLGNKHKKAIYSTERPRLLQQKDVYIRGTNNLYLAVISFKVHGHSEVRIIIIK